jgi:sugar phosphate isomerase/epimerase
LPWFQARGLGFGASDEGRACLPDILAEVAQVGFTGFEVLAPAVPIDTPHTMTDTMARLGLRFAGAHTGAPSWMPEAGARIPDTVDTARRLRAVGCQRLIVSMYPFIPADADAAMLRRVASQLRELGCACRDDVGIPVAFHNHVRALRHREQPFHRIVITCSTAS